MARQSRKSTAPSAIRLSLLGTFTIERKDKPLALYSRKVESLFAYLVLHPQEHAREKLAALFWGNFTDEQARASLRVGLNDLRKKLGDDVILANRETAQINPGIALWVDVRTIADLRLQIADSQSTISNLQSLVSLYHGDLLADFYDDWITPLREEYRAQYLAALLKLIDRARAQSEYAQVIDLGCRALATDPASETAHQHLMFAYAAQGDRTTALDQYAACERALREELSVVPSKETRALYDSIKQKVSIESPAARLTNLPKQLTSFIGREKELEEIRRLLAEHSLVTLIGAGGSGKTRLSIELGRALVSEYSAGVWWVDLSPLVDAARVTDAVAKALGVQERPKQPMTETLVEFLRAKQILLVIDNCEHLINASAELIQTLLSHCENVHVLATSREGLGVAGEQVYRVPSLETPKTQEQISIEQTQQFAAVRLFLERAKSHSTGFLLNEKNSSQVVRICQRLDGIPLALELAAARTNSLSVDEIANRLDDRFRLLTGGIRTALPRQQTLRALIDWSFDLLTEPERVLFRRLAVFAGGWTMQAAEAVCGEQSTVNGSQTDNGLLTTDILDLMTRLIAKSLVIAEEQDSTTRYHMLETIHAYARDQLVARGELERARQWHADYYLKFAQDANANLKKGNDQAHWLNRMKTESNNLRMALGWTLESPARMTLAQDFVIVLHNFWQTWGWFTEGRRWTEQTLTLDATSSLRRANVLNCASTFAKFQGDYARARVTHEEALAIFQAMGDDAGIYLSLDGLAILAGMQGDYARAAELLDLVLAYRRQTNDPTRLATTLNNLAEASRLLDNLERAKELYAETIALTRQMGNDKSLAHALQGLGEVHAESKDFTTAVRLYRQVLQIRKQLGDRQGIQITLDALALATQFLGSPFVAAQLESASDKIRSEMGVPITSANRAEHAKFIAQLRANLGENEFESAWAQGQTLSTDQAIALAMEKSDG